MSSLTLGGTHVSLVLQSPNYEYTGQHILTLTFPRAAGIVSGLAGFVKVFPAPRGSIDRALSGWYHDVCLDLRA